ncbi:MAG: hypothetical protein AUJ75_03965 [Candidatus Omnitrophica bacterium CG1_02_49_10]|nr:MAG: hypothetical protein AUJ75_03965 [Candidatus Omnitrophica bacterium CG1_02_49_10]
MRPKVYFFSLKKGDDRSRLGDGLRRILSLKGTLDFIKNDALVALKLSFGEKDNKGHLSADLIRPVVDSVLSLKAKPFLIETNTLYKGDRQNAVDHINLALRHGYGKLSIPIVIADGLRGEEGKEVSINGPLLKNARIARGALSADSLIGIAHATGHMLSSYGGAIKNIGMGLATRSGKQIQHSNTKPKVGRDKCTACRSCIEGCPSDAIIIRDDKAFIDEKKCVGCAECIVKCAFDAIGISWSEGSGNMQKKMSEYAFAVLKSKAGKSFFINFAIDITKDCDCMEKEGNIIAEDVGILASGDIVALDLATIDTINDRAGRDVFMEAYPSLDWRVQIEHACDIGLGSKDYELEMI